MPFDLFSSSSSATDSRQAAADRGVAQRGSHNISAQDQATSIGANAKINTGLSVEKGNKGNIVVNDIGAVSALASKFTDALQNISSQANQTLAGALSQQQDQSTDALGKVADLSSSAQTGGDSGRNKIVLYVVLAAFAAFGALFYFKK